jgi:hypothetical protein
MGFGANIEFIECLLRVTTNSYNTSLIYSLQMTTAHTKTSQSVISSLVVDWYGLQTTEIPLLQCSRITIECN